jgi:hypothetical protein
MSIFESPELSKARIKVSTAIKAIRIKTSLRMSPPDCLIKELFPKLG